MEPSCYVWLHALYHYGSSTERHSGFRVIFCLGSCAGVIFRKVMPAKLKLNFDGPAGAQFRKGLSPRRKVSSEGNITTWAFDSKSCAKASISALQSDHCSCLGAPARKLRASPPNAMLLASFSRRIKANTVYFQAPKTSTDPFALPPRAPALLMPCAAMRLLFAIQRP